MIHVGIDLHHKNSYVRALDDDGVLYAGRRVYHSDMQQLWQYLSQFGQQPKRVVFEATSNARWLRRQLQEDPTIELVAVTPHKVRIIAETVAKTDKIDATVLATLSKLDTLPRAWLPDDDVEQLRELTRHRRALVQMRTRCKNQVNGALVRQGVLRPYGDIFGTWGLAWLEQAEVALVTRLQIDHWLELMVVYNRQIKHVEDRLYRRLAREDRWREPVAILMSMPGWGKLTALTVLAELGDYRRFSRRSAVSAFAGLVPSSKRSDTHCRYGKITKRGSTHLRSILVEVAINAVKKVPRYSRLYNGLKAKRGGNVAKVAVARQMLEDGWTMLMKQEPFRLMPTQVGSLTRAG
jgi:transposase